MGSDNFPALCRAFLGPDPGLILHHLTGWPERSCYHYARGDRRPPIDFVVALLRSPQGRPFAEAIFRDCTAPWVRDHRRLLRLAIIAERFKAELART